MFKGTFHGDHLKQFTPREGHLVTGAEPAFPAQQTIRPPRRKLKDKGSTELVLPQPATRLSKLKPRYEHEGHQFTIDLVSSSLTIILTGSPPDSDRSYHSSYLTFSLPFYRKLSDEQVERLGAWIMEATYPREAPGRSDPGILGQGELFRPVQIGISGVRTLYIWGLSHKRMYHDCSLVID